MRLVRARSRSSRRAYHRVESYNYRAQWFDVTGAGIVLLYTQVYIWTDVSNICKTLYKKQFHLFVGQTFLKMGSRQALEGADSVDEVKQSFASSSR